jgi:hypothetical protein
MSNQNCLKCGVLFKTYWLKDDMCNGCRNPHLVVEAKVDPKIPDVFAEIFLHKFREISFIDEAEIILGRDLTDEEERELVHIKRRVRAKVDQIATEQLVNVNIQEPIDSRSE